MVSRNLPQKRHRKSAETEDPRPSKVRFWRERGCKNHEVPGSPKSDENDSKTATKREPKTRKIHISAGTFGSHFLEGNFRARRSPSQNGDPMKGAPAPHQGDLS